MRVTIAGIALFFVLAMGPSQALGQDASYRVPGEGLRFRLGFGSSTAGGLLENPGLNGFLGAEVPVNGGWTVGLEGVMNSAQVNDIFALGTVGYEFLPRISATAGAGAFFDNGVQDMATVGARVRLPLRSDQLSLHFRRAFVREGIFMFSVSTTF